MMLRTAMGAVMALFLLLQAAPVFAQTADTSPAPGPAVQAQIEQIVTSLEDEAVRAALLDRLRNTNAAPEDTPAPATSVAQQVAAAMATFARDGAAEVNSISRELTQVLTLGDQLRPNGRDIGPQAIALALTIATTIAAALALNAVSSRVARRLFPAPDVGLLKRAQLTLLAALARLGGILPAWALGYALAVFVFSENNVPSEAQILYLNAFLAFGVLRVVLRCVANPAADTEPVLSQLSVDAQGVIFRNLRLVLGVVVQGFLFVVPLAQIWIGFTAARPLHTLIATTAAVLALLAIRRIARALASDQDSQARSVQINQGTEAEEGVDTAVSRGAEAAWGRIWPPVAVLYVLYAWLLLVTRPRLAADVLIWGTTFTVTAVLLLLAALRLMKAAPNLSAPLPRKVRSKLPKLAPRADQIASLLGFIGAAVLGLVASGMVLHGWNWLDVPAVLTVDTTQTALWRIASALLVTLFAAMLWAVISAWIDERLMNDVTGRTVSSRSRTLLALFRNAFTIVIVVLTTMIALSQLGINIAPLLAGAGVIGLAVGFGAQSLVQDIITGTFIQLENAINEGDVVGVAGVTGGVEKVTIRSVRIRTLDGSVHIIPFSSVGTVTNLTRDFSFHVADIGAAYKEKVSDVKAAMEEAFDRLKAEGDFTGDILAPLEMHGVTELGDSAVVVRARIKTSPGKQWGLGRRYTELVKDVFDERGIEIPFPHRQLMFPEGALRLAQTQPRDVTPAAESTA